MVAMVGVLGVGMATVIATIRREARASRDVKDVSLNTKEGECRP
jgi:adenylate kinase